MQKQSILFIVLLVLVSQTHSSKQTSYPTFKKAHTVCMQTDKCNGITSLNGKFYLRSGQLSDHDFIYSIFKSKGYSLHSNIPMTPLDRPAYLQLKGITLGGKLGHPVYANLVKAMQACTVDHKCGGVSKINGKYYLRTGEVQIKADNKKDYSYKKNF